jgi:cytoskeletal protein CcmA (bactofilin family)
MAFNAKKKMDVKILDVDASMQGNLSFKDPVNLRINGSFDGNLDARGNLTIGPSSTVKGDVSGDNVIVGGKFNGKLVAREMLTLLPNSVVEGDIFPARLNVAEGAVLEGRCSMLRDFMNAEELSRYLEVDLNSVLEWAGSGKVPGIKEGEIWKFERKSIDAWVASGKIGK